jgi:hypothetical protein
VPHVALEQWTSLLRMRSNFSSRCEWGNQSSLQSSMTPRYLIFETTFIPHTTVVRWHLYSSQFIVNISISASFSLEISSLCSVHHFSMVWSLFCSVLRMAAVMGPCIIIIMSSAYTTVLTFGALESSALRLMTMFHKVRPELTPVDSLW